MNKINYIKILAFIFSLIFLIAPFVIFAEIGTSPTIKNPLGNTTTLEGLLGKLMTIISTLGAIIVVFFIILSGYKFVAARGNPGEIEKAKDMFLYTVIGGAILLGADIIANVVINTVNTTVGRTP